MGFTNIKSQLLSIFGGLIALIIVGAILWVALWEFNIFKKEPKLTEEIIKIEKELEYINELNYSAILEKLIKLNIVPQILEVPEIKDNEIGKTNIFE